MITLVILEFCFRVVSAIVNIFLLERVAFCWKMSVLSICCTFVVSKLEISTVGADITRTSTWSLPGFLRACFATSAKLCFGHLASLSRMELYALAVFILQPWKNSKFCIDAVWPTESAMYSTLGFDRNADLGEDEEEVVLEELEGASGYKIQ